MIKLILIFLILIYATWVIYRLFFPFRNKRNQLSMPIAIIITVAFLVGGSLFFILPKIGLVIQKLIPFFINPIGFFQMLIQKIVPLISFFRGILPI